MIEAIDQFRISIRRAKDLNALHDRISAATTPVVDLSDLLRAQFVLAVSALDFFVHEYVRLAMLATLSAGRVAAKGIGKFNVSLQSVIAMQQSPPSSSWLDDEIRQRHGFLSFQQPGKIADAIRLVSDISLWDSVSKALGTSSETVKRRLQLIVERRNKIAHEADLDPSFPGVRWPISSSDAMEATNFVEAICEQIHILAR